jgi:hypothetical protein
MFANRIRSNQNHLNTWFFSEEFNAEQLQNLKYDVDKLRFLSKQQKNLVSRIFSFTKSTHLKEELIKTGDQLEKCILDTEISSETKTFMLAQSLIAFNEYLFNNVIDLTGEVSSKKTFAFMK